MNRQRGERHEAADQPRRHEGAMARAGQRVVPRRRMHQRIDIVADDVQNGHGCSRFGLLVANDAPERPLYRCLNLSERT